MSRKFIATILAASLAITSFSAAPARAGNDDLVKFLAGATALIIIGSALDSKPARATVRRDRDQDQGRRHDHDRGHDRWHHDKRKRALPAYCRSSVWTQQGRRHFLDARCLNQNYAQARYLPQQCRTTAQYNGHGRRGYSIRCLKRHGYEIARN